MAAKVQNIIVATKKNEWKSEVALQILTENLKYHFKKSLEIGTDSIYPSLHGGIQRQHFLWII